MATCQDYCCYCSVLALLLMDYTCIEQRLVEIMVTVKKAGEIVQPFLAKHEADQVASDSYILSIFDEHFRLL